MEVSLKVEKDKNEEVLTSHNTDLIDATTSLKRHREELNNFTRWQQEAKLWFEALEIKVNSLDHECNMRQECIYSLEDTIAELCSLMEEMESCFCRCTDKENERESKGEEEEEVVKDNQLDYASDKEY